jgi:hypothetical protein
MRLKFVFVTLVLAALSPWRAGACIGDECLQIWSTEAGGGALTIEFDFSAKVQTFRAFCTGDEAQCLYSALDPGFIATPEPEPGSGFFAVADGTRVTLEVVTIAPGLTISVDGVRLDEAGDRASLGTFPDVHVHPSWQLLVPGSTFGDFPVTFRLLTDSPAYAGSEIYSLDVTNVEPTPVPTPANPTPTATATATATPVATAACAGDCDASADVTVDEILTCVNAALGTGAGCSACDGDGDTAVTVDEIIAAVNAALVGCTTGPVVTLAELQRTIFTPRCATPLCHDAGTAGGGLVLVDGASHGELVGVRPQAEIAAAAGQLLVDPGKPENSFLVIKLTGPPRGAGSRMPMLGGFLTDEQVEAVSNWILGGAQP